MRSTRQGCITFARGDRRGKAFGFEVVEGDRLKADWKAGIALVEVMVLGPFVREGRVTKSRLQVVNTLAVTSTGTRSPTRQCP